jgi:putative membrane protein
VEALGEQATSAAETSVMKTALGDAGLPFLVLWVIALAAFAACKTAADSGADQVFVASAASGGMAEVEMGKLAVDKASSPDVKKFAEQMVSDHTKANEELDRIASGKSLKIPRTLDLEHKTELDTLTTKSGADFDKAYAMAQIAGHEKMQRLLSDEAKTGNDPDLRAFAEKTLPTVRQHYQMAKDLEAKVGT